MMHEVKRVRQLTGQGRRRWFCDDYFDLIVWNDKRGARQGFQLCYDLAHDQRSLTWRADSGFSHEAVDEGDHFGKMKRAPIMVADGVFDATAIAAEFKLRGAEIDPAVVAFVLEKLATYGR
jgi:hypothetical protein